ncbi:MAG TPA: hypothetical protein VHN99_03605 [Deinococcales bacterium]|nr:hypothetical protein [Deinococcales bacterium]
MLLRRIYQIVGWALGILGAFSVLSSLYRTVVSGAGLGAFIVGLGVGFLLAALGYAVWQFATGPETRGKNVLGIERKAELERELALARKAGPPKRA